ncbi:aspartate kinase [Pelagibaculum spongiae]|uniref:aspartate kinase n=1 Tax=Pelagibaculum spongiae TaxID=2080658 RepID=A0A2V1H0H2_9GAMM|nr:aspartate kinase [Pelagibaculum spongiae]PVZ72149.1 aspartate kinase [Pelagibaculum spongiae]
MQHTVEKIGGTSMSNYEAVRDNIICYPEQPYNRIFVVSAYGGVTDLLLEHKKTGDSGIYGLFAHAEDGQAWRQAMDDVRARMLEINAGLFEDPALKQQADQFISDRLGSVEDCLTDLRKVCAFGHFQLSDQLMKVREMLASIGEAHSAHNLAFLLQQEGINAKFVDLSGWRGNSNLSLDEAIAKAFAEIDLQTCLPIVTGYANCVEGLMTTFDRGYSEMTFSRIAVITEATEAVIHKEFHLSSADPRVVGEGKVVPIGRTNYDVADQLANLGMEAIHPKAAKGLRKAGIALRIKNTFDPAHSGTLITSDYCSDEHCVEIIAGRRHVVAIEVFDQEMSGEIECYDRTIVELLHQQGVEVITKDLNANTITHYISTGIKRVRRVVEQLEQAFPDAEVSTQKVALVSAIGSSMKVPGILAETTSALAEAGISVLAMHQCMRQVDMQFVLDEADYHTAVKSMHKCLIERHNHQYAIRVA